MKKKQTKFWAVVSTAKNDRYPVGSINNLLTTERYAEVWVPAIFSKREQAIAYLKETGGKEYWKITPVIIDTVPRARRS